MKGSCMYTVSMLFLYAVGFSTWQVGDWLVEALPWVRWGCFNFTKFQNHRSHVQKCLCKLQSRKFRQWKKHSLLLNDLYLECIFHCHRSSENAPHLHRDFTQRFSPPSFSQAIPTFAAEVRPGWKPQGKHQRAIFQQRHVGSFLSIF